MLRRILVNLAKRNQILRIILRKLRKLSREIKYKKYKQINTNDKMIIFESFMGRKYSDSPKAIYEYMIKSDEFGGYQFIWAFKNPSLKKDYFKNENTIITKYGSRNYLKYYAEAKYWITNSRLPEYLEKKQDQVYIQTWHGTPLKKLGYDIQVEGGNALNSIKDIRKKYRDDAIRYDYLITPSEFCTEKLTSAFNLVELNKENIIIEEGYPRNDFLFNYTHQHVSEMKNKLEIDETKKVILYAPTWRDNQHVSGLGYTYELGIDFKKLEKEIGDSYVILFRAHYFISNSFNFEEHEGFVIDVSEYDDINNIYIISDMIITDYSSVFFDFANLKRPMLFYMYDYEEYNEKLRDFYIDIKDLPGPIIKNEVDLIKEIKNIDNYYDKYRYKYDEFNKKFNYLDGNNCSKKVVDRIKI